VGPFQHPLRDRYQVAADGVEVQPWTWLAAWTGRGLRMGVTAGGPAVIVREDRLRGVPAMTARWCWPMTGGLPANLQVRLTFTAGSPAHYGVMTSGPGEGSAGGLPGDQNPGAMTGQPEQAPGGGHQPDQPQHSQLPPDQAPPGQPGYAEPGSTWAYGPPPAPSPGLAGWPGAEGTSGGSRHRGRRIGLLAGGVAALLMVGTVGGFIGNAIGSSHTTAAGGSAPARFPARPGGAGPGPGSGFGGVPAGGSGQFPSGGSGQFPSGGSFGPGSSGTGSGPANASSIASRVDPGLVDVNITVDYGQARGAGTGMVLTPGGVVLTNNHVIDGATSISVTDVGNGKTYQAHVAGYDLSKDVAIL
jgi:hypothetical protein